MFFSFSCFAMFMFQISDFKNSSFQISLSLEEAKPLRQAQDNTAQPILHSSFQYSDSPISVNTIPSTDTTTTMLPMMRFSIQMPRRLNCVRSLLTK